MNKDLAANMNMYASTEDFLNINFELVEKYPRLKLERTAFSTNRADLEVQVRKQTEVTTGITADKVVSFSSLGNMVVNLSLKALIWAKDTNSQAMVAIFANSPTTYKNQTYAKKLDQGKAVYAALNGNAAALAAYNVKDAELAAMFDLVKICETAIIAPGQATAGKKTAKGTIETIEAKIDENLTTMDSLITGEYSVTEPTFVMGYQNSRKLDNAGIRHTGISATITDATTSKAIENATLTIADLNKTATSNMVGLAEIIKMKAGSYHISIAAEGYTTQLMDVTVGRSRVVDLDVALVLG